MERGKQPKEPKKSIALPLPAVLLGGGGRSCIVGRKYLHVVKMDEPIGVTTLPLESRLDPALLKGKPYPVRRAARIYLKSQIAKTERARRVLRALAKGHTEVLA